MKKTKQKQFTKQWELDAAIVKLKRLAERKEKKAIEWDAEFHVYDRLANDPDSTPHMCKWNNERALSFKKKATTLRQQINGIVMRRIPALVRAKAALYTKPLPGFDQDMGVVAQ